MTPETPADESELQAYALGRRLCLRADPPCLVRPCEEHLAVAQATLRSAVAPDVEDAAPTSGSPPSASSGATEPDPSPATAVRAGCCWRNRLKAAGA